MLTRDTENIYTNEKTYFNLGQEDLRRTILILPELLENFNIILIKIPIGVSFLSEQVNCKVCIEK